MTLLRSLQKQRGAEGIQLKTLDARKEPTALANLALNWSKISFFYQQKSAQMNEKNSKALRVKGFSSVWLGKNTFSPNSKLILPTARISNVHAEYCRSISLEVPGNPRRPRGIRNPSLVPFAPLVTEMPG